MHIIASLVCKLSIALLEIICALAKQVECLEAIIEHSLEKKVEFYMNRYKQW